MKTQRYPARLGDLRVSEELHQKLVQISEAQEMSLADTRRLALHVFCQPPPAQVRLEIPIIGRIVADEKLGNKVEWVEEGE